jgi:hypothetical protein
MHIMSHPFDAVYSDVVMQKSVELLGEHHSIKLGISIEVGCHLTGVNTGIGSTCTCYCDGLTQQERQTAFQLALHRDAIGLYLPAVIVGAVIAKPYEISHLFLYLRAKLANYYELCIMNYELFCIFAARYEKDISIIDYMVGRNGPAGTEPRDAKRTAGSPPVQRDV